MAARNTLYGISYSLNVKDHLYYYYYKKKKTLTKDYSTPPITQKQKKYISTVSEPHNSTIHVEPKLQTFIAHNSSLLPVVPEQELDKTVWSSSQCSATPENFPFIAQGDCTRVHYTTHSLSCRFRRRLRSFHASCQKINRDRPCLS